MTSEKYAQMRFIFPLAFLLCLVFVAACQTTEQERPRPEKLQTQLLVREPEAPLPADRPIMVRSHTQDPEAVSHVELYAVDLPSGEKDVLLRSDPAPFAQTSFTVSQTFIPLQTGHYVIKVVGYNIRGEKAESNFIGFDVVR